ncbi:MAG: hypothetical protein OEX01_09330 [Candidatus Bathyarchaeota archaeon]|nr:hypothetical protein [Candidatus Bathyarchaeota archaeon]
MTKVLCPKCSQKGWLTTKNIKGHDYWYVCHYIDYKAKKQKWCYIGKNLPSNLKVLENEKKKETKRKT